MSLLLASGQRNTEKRSSNALCGYCDKVFNDPRALGGHLKAHQGQTLPKKNLNRPIARPRSSLSVTRPMPRPLKPVPVKGSAGGSGTNQLAASGTKKPPLIPKKSGSELRGSNKPTPKITTNTNNHNHESSVSDNTKASLPVQAPQPSSLTKPSYASSNYSSPSCFGVVYHPSDRCFSRDLVNVDQVSGNGSPEIKYPNKGTYAIPVTNHTGSYRWPGIPVNTMIPYQDRFPEEHGKYEEYNNNPALALRVNNPYLTEASVVPVMMYPPRRMVCNPMIAPEIHLNEEVEAEAKAKAKTGSNLDLSLHL